MNIQQKRTLLKLRGQSEFNSHGQSLGSIIRFGGTPTKDEMIEVNEKCMNFFMEKYEQEKQKNEALLIELEKLEKRDYWLRCLETAGVDNWEGFDIAIDIRDQKHS